MTLPTFKVVYGLGLRPDMIPQFKKEILHLQDPRQDVWHNHFDAAEPDEVEYGGRKLVHANGSGNLVRYPRIQFRFEQMGRTPLAAIWGVAQGAGALRQFVEQQPEPVIRWGGNALQLQIVEAQSENFDLHFRDTGLRLIPYSLSHYLPFNEERYQEFRKLLFFQDKLALIEHLVGQHLRNFAEAVGWEALSHRVLTVKTLDLKAFKTAKYLPKTGNETLSYVSVDLQVGINAELPDEIALGQLVSLGYGTLRRLRKPGPNDG